MSAAVSMPDQASVYRDAVVHVIADHIRTRCEAAGAVLVHGTPDSAAEKIVRSWSLERMSVFYSLAKNHSKFQPKGTIAERHRWSIASLDSFWRSIGSYVVEVRVREGMGDERRKLRLFRCGRERRFSSGGIALFLRLDPPTFEMAKQIADSTFESTKTFKENYEGACETMEGDLTKEEAERTEARRRLDERTDGVVSGPQLSLMAVNDRK